MHAIRTHSAAAMMIVAALCARPALSQEATRNRIGVTATTRAYTVGDSSVTERVVAVRYDLFGPSFRLRLDGSALGYTAAGSKINGTLPIGARFDYMMRPGDSVAVYVKTASQPLDLTTQQTSALATAGTSTVDLESTGLGAPALGGVRATVAFPVGDFVLALRGGVEVEPTPSGSAPVYWRGTTLKGGVAFTSNVDWGTLAFSADATKSSADSLNGRNLFPGGGSVMLQAQVDASVLNPFDPLEDERWPIRAALFYAKPFSSDRADQPNLLIPQGDLLGGIAAMFLPVNGVTFAPTVQYLHESSSSGSTTAISRNTISGTAWTLQTGLDVGVPLGNVFELTPQAGYAFGTVGATFSQGVALRRGRGVVRTSGFDDSIRGYYLGVQLTATF